MNYCSQCGGKIRVRIPDGDNMPRHVCDACGRIHYQNPNIVVGCIAEWEDRILLCRRAIEPRYGEWTLPAGFLENGETVQQGAARETFEEAQARVEIQTLYSLFNLPQIHQVYLIFRGRLRYPEHGPGTESLETLLVQESEIPWERIAFPVIQQSLALYYQDRARGEFPLHTGDIMRPDGPEGRVQIRLHSPNG